jgi:hypothetical protein
MDQPTDRSRNPDTTDLEKRIIEPEKKAKPTRKKPEPRTRKEPAKRSKKESVLEIDLQDFDPSFLDDEGIEVLFGDHPTPDQTPLIGPSEHENFTSAIMILSLLDGIISMALGPKYTMTKDERKMLSEPLDRMLKRLPINIAENYGRFMDPALFVMGLVAWGSRISRQRNEELSRQPDRTGPPPKPQPHQPPDQPAPTNYTPDEAEIARTTSAPPEISMHLGENGNAPAF